MITIESELLEINPNLSGPVLETGALCFNNVMTKQNQPSTKTSLWDIANNALGPTTVIALAIVIWATWLQIQAMMNWQSGMEYIFIVFAPFMYAAYAFLFIRGIVLLIRAARRREASKGFRIALAIIGLIFLIPGGYILYGSGAYYYVKYNAEHISADKDVLQLVKECKVTTIRREYIDWNVPAEQRATKASVYLKESAKSDSEKGSYFYGYRSFNPEYYDELAKAVLSNEPACGKVELYDEHRENIPITYNWVSKEEALEALEACKIQNIFTTDSPSSDSLDLSSNTRSESASIYMIMDPISEGFAGKLYLKDADQDTHSSVLDFAKTKKGSCRYKQPNIDGVE